jgi:hypothetical protein
VLQMHFQTDMIFGHCAGGVVATFFGEAVRVLQGFLIGKVTQKKGRFGSAIGVCVGAGHCLVPTIIPHMLGVYPVPGTIPMRPGCPSVCHFVVL